MSVQPPVPVAEVWIWKDLPYAPSHTSWTWQMLCVAPRSICSHCGSLYWLAQRVPGSPSTVLEAMSPVFSLDDEVAVLPSAALTVPQAAGGGEDGVVPPMVP